jgi:hypothetical protein
VTVRLAWVLYSRNAHVWRLRLEEDGTPQKMNELPGFSGDLGHPEDLEKINLILAPGVSTRLVAGGKHAAGVGLYPWFGVRTDALSGRLDPVRHGTQVVGPPDRQPSFARR